MKTIYLNSEYECFVAPCEQTITQVQTNVFEGKCDTYIEGMRFVPQGETWQRADGVSFTGEMVSPFKDSQLLDMTQRLYEEINNKI